MWGQVEHAPPAADAPGPMRSAKRRARLPSGSTVWVRARSRAQIAFDRDARCTFGLEDVATELVTRFGSTPDGPPLYWQRTGRSRCTFERGSRRKVYFCELSIDCPVIVTTRGRARETTTISSSAHVAQAGGGQTTVTVVRLRFCAPHYRVEVSDEFGGGAVEGGAYVQANGVMYVQRKHVLITRTDSIMHDENGTTETHSITIDSRPAGGYCVIRRPTSPRNFRIRGG